MKKTILTAVFALCAFIPQSYAVSDAQWADDVVARLKRVDVTSSVCDRDNGIVKVIYDSKVGDVVILIDCDTKDDTIYFHYGATTHVRQNQIANVLPLINAFNARTRFTKACIDPEDGQLMVSVWSNAETLPTGGSIKSVLNAIVDAACELVPAVVEAR